MFVNKIDWNDPKFSRWHLSKLGSLSNAQKAAHWDDDEIDNPPITDNEQIVLCKLYDCRVELFHSNVCYGVEKSWPKKYFDVADFESLQSGQQKQILKTMEKHAVSIHKKYVNDERRNNRIKCHNANVFALFWEERRCRLHFQRLKKIGEMEMIQKNDLMDQSHFTENTQMPELLHHKTFDKGPDADIQNTSISPRITRSRRSAETSRHANDTNIENVVTPSRRNTRSAHESTSNVMSKKTTPDRRTTRSTYNNSKEIAIETEIFSMSRTRLSPNITPNRPVTRSATKNSPMNEQITLRRRQETNRPNDSPCERDVSVIITTPSRYSNRTRHNISSDVEITPKLMSNHPNTRSYLRRTFGSFSSGEGNQTVINTQSTDSSHKYDLSFSVDTPNFDSPQGGLDIFSQNVGTPTVNQQPSTHVATNDTPQLSVDESVFNLSLGNNMSAERNRRSNNNSTEEIDTEDFEQLDDNQTSTQK